MRRRRRLLPEVGVDSPARAEVVIWEVSKVNRYVRELIEDDSLLRDLWVEGEVSNFVVAMSGHAYFTLKDSGSQLKCVLFRHQLARVRRRPENGELAVARGPLRVYEPQGAYQLYVEFVAPAGLGELQLRLEELRARLEAEGLFDESRKRDLPLWPRRVGVVTSATGAVIHDIRTVIERRWPLVEIVLAPTPVQGEDAPPRICQAVSDLNAYGDVDVIVIARGGGSVEDLSPFNDELVARAVFGSRVPVVSAIGHETDVTICDLVADRRAPTPSAAAEMIVPDSDEVRSRVRELERALVQAASRDVSDARQQVAREFLALTRYSPLAIVDRHRGDLVDLERRAETAMQHALTLSAERIRSRELQLSALDPRSILGRGYAVVSRPDTGVPITSIDQIETGLRLRTRVADGAFNSQVTGD